MAINSPSSSDAGSYIDQSTSSFGSEVHYVIAEPSLDADDLAESQISILPLTLWKESEVQFGPISVHDGDDQDSTLSWNPHEHTTTQVCCYNGVFANIAAKNLLHI